MNVYYLWQIQWDKNTVIRYFFMKSPIIKVKQIESTLSKKMILLPLLPYKELFFILYTKYILMEYGGYIDVQTCL